MTKFYKRKRLIESDSRDSKGCNDLRKAFNSSERQRGKKECKEGIIDVEKHNMPELRWQIESKMSSDCYYKEKEAIRKGESFNCTCTDPYSWSDEEVLRWHGMKI